MKFNLYPKENKYVWSLCIITTAMAFSLSLAAVSNYLLPDSVWFPLAGMLISGIYSIEVARQSYKYQRRWPQWSMMPLSSCAMFSLLDPPTFAVGVGVVIFNLLLWFVAYKLSTRLVLISPRNSMASKWINPVAD